MVDVAGITYFDGHGWGLSSATCQALFCVRLWCLSACLHVAGLWCITLAGGGAMKHHRSVLQVMSRGARGTGQSREEEPVTQSRAARP